MSTAVAEDVNSRTAVGRLLTALQSHGQPVRQNGDKWIAGCPCHDDQRPSLSIKVGNDGRVLVHCHAGCSMENILAPLAMTPADLFEHPVRPDKGRRLVNTYKYPDEQGQLLFEMCRYEPKDFSARRPDGHGRWKPGLADVRRVLYRLPELIAARPDHPVFVVEGEKDVDRLIELGLVATTNPFGAGKWRDEFSKFLRDRRVVLLPDNDSPGQAHALQVAGALCGLAAEVKIVELPDLPPKGDVSDWLALQGASTTTDEARARLLELTERGTPWHPAAPATSMTTPLGVAAVVESALGALECPPTRDAVVAALRGLALAVRGCDGLERAAVRGEAVACLKQKGLPPAEAQTLAGTALRDDEVARTDCAQGGPLVVADPEPWPEPVDGQDLAEGIAEAFRRHIALPRGADIALALWTLHTHAHDAADVSPTLALTSAAMRCGKTNTLHLLSALVPRPFTVSNLTSAVVFRVVDKFKPTLLMDEAETYVHEREELRGILNAGHSRAGAVVPRLVGSEYEPRMFSTWCPKAAAMIGRLPPTLEDRAVVIRLRRKAPGEATSRLRLDRLREYEPLRRRAWRWGRDHLGTLRDADPQVPEALHDRAQDNWRPLLAIADQVGGEWPARARGAALVLADAVPESEDPGEMLLADVRDLFIERGADRLESAEIVAALVAREDRPWQESNHGKPISPAQLARLLRPFGVEPKVFRIGDKTHRGYWLDDLSDAFSRYLSPLEAKQAKHVAIAARGSALDGAQHGEHVTAPGSTFRSRQSRLVSGVSGREAVGAPLESLTASPPETDGSANVRALESDFDSLRGRYMAWGLPPEKADAMALTAVKALAAASWLGAGHNGKTNGYPGGGS